MLLISNFVKNCILFIDNSVPIIKFFFQIYRKKTVSRTVFHNFAFFLLKSEIKSQFTNFKNFIGDIYLINCIRTLYKPFKKVKKLKNASSLKEFSIKALLVLPKRDKSIKV